MFKPPEELATEVWTRVPDALRITDEPSRWSQRVRGGATCDCFLEGPSFDRDGNLYLVDIAYGRIFRVSGRGEWSVAARYDGIPNGLKIARDGTLYIADQEQGILLMDPASGDITPYCDRYDGLPLIGPNDLYFASNGDLWFTDQGPSDLRRPIGRVFRVRPGGRPELVLDGIPSPNGLVMTPDDKALLVAVTRMNNVWRIPLRGDGSLGKVGVFVQLSGSKGGGPDGLAMDEAGNLAIAHAFMGTVWVFDEYGEPTLRIRSAAGDGTTNLAYGGPDRRDLYITESHTGSVLRCRMPVPGRAMYSHA